MKMALPSSGLSGVEKNAEMMAWPNNMAESVAAWSRTMTSNNTDMVIYWPRSRQVHICLEQDWQLHLNFVSSTWLSVCSVLTLPFVLKFTDSSQYEITCCIFWFIINQKFYKFFIIDYELSRLYKFERRKDTWHREWLSKGVECRAPRDLPGSNVRKDKPQLQHQFVHLQQDTWQLTQSFISQ